MFSSDTDRLIYLSVLLGITVLAVLSTRGSLRQFLRPLLIWLGIFTVVTLGYGAWMSVSEPKSQQTITTNAQGHIILPLQSDGHFQATLIINDTPVDFVVDTGASEIVLTQQDAQRIGFNLDRLNFMNVALTANGTVATAPVRLADVQFGPHRDTNVRAMINGGDLFQSLLGMSYLRRFGSIELTPEAMIIRR